MISGAQRDRRALVVGGMIVATLGGTVRGLPALHNWRATEDASAAYWTQTAADARTSVVRLRETTDSLRARRRRARDVDSAFVSGTSLAMAGAAMVGELVEDADASDAKLGPVQIEIDTAKTLDNPRVRARTSLSGDLESIMQFLSLVEAGPPLLAVRELSIVQPDAQLPDSRTETLRVELVVEGLAKVVLATVRLP